MRHQNRVLLDQQRLDAFDQRGFLAGFKLFFQHGWHIEDRRGGGDDRQSGDRGNHGARQAKVMRH